MRYIAAEDVAKAKEMEKYIIVLCALRCVPMNAAKQRSDHTSCRCFIFL